MNSRRWMLPLVSGVGAVLSACGTVHYGISALTPAEVNTQAVAYNHARVQIRGYVMIGTDTNLIYQSRALHEKFSREYRSTSYNDRARLERLRKEAKNYCIRIENPSTIRDYLKPYKPPQVMMTLTLSGVLLTDPLPPDIIPLGGCDNDSRLVVDHVSH